MPTVDRFSPAQIRRLVNVLDSNKDGRQSFPEVDLYPAHARAINSFDEDRLAVSDVVRGMIQGKLSFAVGADRARQAAETLDTNRNGLIDAAEVRFSADVRDALTYGVDRPVTVDDLESAFAYGVIVVGRDLMPQPAATN